MSTIRQQVDTPWVNIAVTGVASQELLPPLTGYQYSITQIGHHENRGDIRSIYLLFGNQEHMKFTTGASGSIIWDMAFPQDLPIGSGLYGHLDFPGNIDYLIKYVVRDCRIPTNLDPRTFVNVVARKPDFFGNQ